MIRGGFASSNRVRFSEKYMSCFDIITRVLAAALPFRYAAITAFITHLRWRLPPHAAAGSTAPHAVYVAPLRHGFPATRIFEPTLPPQVPFFGGRAAHGRISHAIVARTTRADHSGIDCRYRHSSAAISALQSWEPAEYRHCE